jgi:DNA helicase II / ATP-dependent DNA helicase PcrA
MEYLKSLNKIQRQAVEAIDGPVLVIAGPGSGKTRVLTYRIAYLIDQGVRPDHILALTFTNKAAREMKERIAAVVGTKANSVWAGTFHSIFARILRVEAKLIGFPSDFTIYDTDDSKSLINAIIKDIGVDPKVYVSNTVRNRISSAKSNLITPKAYADDPALLQADTIAGMPRIGEIYARYVSRCQRAGAMDFDDLLYQIFRLFHQNPEGVLQKYQSRFTHLLVDEFQDTNYLQYAIIKKLTLYPESPRNLCAVGDDAQSIYAFRGATIDNILNFEKDYPGIRSFKLEQNYRSTDPIVQAANSVIGYNNKQIRKLIWTEIQEGEKIKLIRALSDSEEARRVADLILELKNRQHLQNKEIAILYRTNAQSRLFEEALRKNNLQYKVYGGLSFYSRKEVKDVLAYLRLLVNPNDDEAFRRIVNYPRRGIGNTALEKLITYANANGISYWQGAIQLCQSQPSGFKSLLGFMKLMAEILKKAKTVNAYDLAWYAVNKSGLITELKQDTSAEGLSRLENVQSLLDGIKDFVENDEVFQDQNIEDKSIASFLQSVALLTDFDNEEGEDDNVALMSVHAAKGLEFRSVFVVGMEENLFPSAMALSQQDGLDEERRLFYVAITRAKEVLTLSYAKNRYRFGQLKQSESSRFLNEIKPEFFEQHTAAALQRDQSPRSGVSGIFGKKPILVQKPVPQAQLADFKPSPMSQIVPGVKVLHQRFGTGTVLKLDGANESKVATIRFDGSMDEEKKIMLKFAKIQVIPPS